MARILKSFVLPADELSDGDVGAPAREKDIASRLALKQKNEAMMEDLTKALALRYSQASGTQKKLPKLDFNKTKDQLMKK